MFDQIIPFGRHGKAEEVARTVVFLASDLASYTSGATHVIDGALLA
jgi:NAD(P)-dependent dehydrogenase (short-subunit alcohol dehydrogenase family)